MVAMAEETDGEVVVPPSLRALLAARLDRLDEAERRVLERCAIEGEVFHRGAVQALTPEEPRVTSRLAALVRRELIRPETPIIAGEDGFRFRHLLIRDAAYDALPKAVRSELHERFATWLDGHGGAIVELDELLGYHLERACRYRDELGLATDESVTADARRHLLAAGHRAVARSDYRAAAGLLERAAALSSPTEPDLAFEMVLGDALVWSGRGEEAVRRADALAAKSSAADDRVGELCGRIQGAVHRQTEEASKELPALLDEALPVFEAEGNDAALYLAYSAVAVAEDVRGQMRAALAADERAVFHAGRAGLPQPGPGFVAYCHFVGPTPVPELLAWLDEHAPLSGGDQFGAAYRANALAMLGRFDEARGILVGARAQARDRGGGLLLANLTAFESAWVERWAGDPAAAAEFGFEGFRLHEDLGEPGWLAWSAMTLAESLYQAGRVDEAEAWAARAAGSRVGDVSEEILWRQVTAKVLASRGEFDEAERLARESISIVEGTDMLDRQGDAHAALAEVLTLAGRTGEAAAALKDALDRYERKGNMVMAARTRERLREGLRGA
jgi:tetratricopeptide (TPR) repeat protein